MGPWSSSTPQNFCGGAPIGKKCSGSQITLWNCKVLRPIDPRDNTANFPHSLPLEFLGLCFFGIIANFELWFHNLFGCWWLEYSWEFELKSNEILEGWVFVSSTNSLEGAFRIDDLACLISTRAFGWRRQKLEKTISSLIFVEWQVNLDWWISRPVNNPVN